MIIIINHTIIKKKMNKIHTNKQTFMYLSKNERNINFKYTPFFIKIQQRLLNETEVAERA